MESAKLEGEGIKTAHLIQIDVTDQSSVDTAAQLISKERGHLDVLVNNAGKWDRGCEEMKLLSNFTCRYQWGEIWN